MTKSRGSGVVGEDQRLVRVKLVNVAMHLDPMFVEQRNIIFDRVNPISKSMFAKKYGLCN